MSTLFVIALMTFCLTGIVVSLSVKRDLMMYQQNSYRPDRYRRWMREAGESTRTSRLVAMAVCMFMLVRFIHPVVALAVAAVFAVWETALLYRRKYKKPLVFTARARRIYAVSAILTAVFAAVVAAIAASDPAGCIYMAVAALVAVYAVSYWILMAADWLLKPVEKAINRRYYNEAASILASMPHLKIIGITGSYGKTSTKHYLHRILSEQFDVLMTPGNFNTTLGVIRTVREHLKPYNEVFIVEMGAKQPGDIREICDLVHPTRGILTAVGPQHLESFGTISNVQATKFELVDALPADGLAVINNDFEYIANRPVDSCRCARYAVEHTADSDFHATDIRYTPKGTHFTIRDAAGAEVLTLYTHLVGRCNVSNLLAAVIMALDMGVDKDKIRYAVEQIAQVEHRLSVKTIPGGLTIIDDAYNSNPVGSQMAMEVLAGMTTGRRIVITPGMIELGSDQHRLNSDLGQAIARSADIAIIVGEYNREAILEGIDRGGMDRSRVHTVDTFARAQQLMISIAAAGDTVLYENDLPDTFK